MIIGIDGRTNSNQKSGVGYLVDNMVSKLFEIDHMNRYKIFGGYFNTKNKNIRSLVLPKTIQRGINLVWRYLAFPPVNFFIGKTDIFFFPNFVDFPVITKRRILMIPDMSFVQFPQFTEKRNLRVLNRGVSASAKRADKILTISESAKSEIIDHYKIDPNKVVVVYLAPNDGIIKVDDLRSIEDVRKKYGIKNKYILFVGTIEPRKNIKGLIHAFYKLSDKIRKEYQLVIAGGKGWYYDEVFDLIEKYEMNDEVIFTGYANESDLSCIYSGASLFVFPSFYEGFGIPVLEAFKCGVPVISSSASSLPEVGGDAVLYFDPYSTEDIRRNIERVLEDKELADSLIKKGSKRLERFSWEKSSEKLLEVINALII